MTTETDARDRNGLEVLSYEACQERLRSGSVGRVAIVDAGTPTIRPVTYAMDGSSVVFRSLVGSKLDAAERSRPVAFEIDDHDPEARTGWSVLVTGVADVVEEPEEVARLEALGLDTWALPRTEEASWVRVRADTVTGRAAAPAD
jgi:uncharacterized protein